MSCEQLLSTIKKLMRDIAFKEEQLEELKKQPSTLQLIEVIKKLAKEVEDMKQEFNRLNNQYKQNCQ